MATQSFVFAGEVRLLHDATYNLADTDIDNRGDQRLGGRFDVGEKDMDLLNRERLIRQIVKFELPGIRNGLESAKLRVFLEEIEGAPAGAVSLFHSVADNDLEPTISDYEDSSYVDTFLDVVQPEDEGRQYYELDVTELVLTDYANDGDDRLSAFRFEVSEAMFVNDGQSNFYRFGQNVNRPELTLTFVPEPSAAALAIFALAAVTCLRRRTLGT